MSQLSNSPSSVQHVRLIFFLVIIAYFMDIIDASIVTVALPSIRLEFGASIANSQWIYGAYAITLAGFLLLMGRAGDIYGQKKIFVSGISPSPSHRLLTILGWPCFPVKASSPFFR